MKKIVKKTLANRSRYYYPSIIFFLIVVVLLLLFVIGFTGNDKSELNNLPIRYGLSHIIKNQNEIKTPEIDDYFSIQLPLEMKYYSRQTPNSTIAYNNEVLSDSDYIITMYVSRDNSKDSLKNAIDEALVYSGEFDDISIAYEAKPYSLTLNNSYNTSINAELTAGDVISGDAIVNMNVNDSHYNTFNGKSYHYYAYYNSIDLPTLNGEEYKNIFVAVVAIDLSDAQNIVKAKHDIFDKSFATIKPQL